jgi:RNA-directed DNA polymerase
MVVHAGQGLTQEALIGQLNPKIRGWARYYRSVVAKKVLNDCDYHLYPLLLRWAKRRHPRKSASWIRLRYWRTVGQDHWRFASPDGYALTNHAAIRIQRHVKVKGNASPFDGNLLYWAKRLQQSHPLTMSRLGALLHKQQGKCRWCELLFQEGDLLGPDPMYSITIMDNFSRAIISSAMSPKQDLTAYLIVLHVRYNQGIRHRFLTVDENMQ